MSKAMHLYGHLVCKKCYYGFANRRQGAWILDVIFMSWIPVIALSVVVGMVMGPGSSKESLESATTAVSWGWWIFAFAFKDGFSGQSLGKRICGVQVLDVTTKNGAGFAESFKRNIPLAIPGISLVALCQMCKGPRIGDRWANTKVIWKKYAGFPVFS